MDYRQGLDEKVGFRGTTTAAKSATVTERRLISLRKRKETEPFCLLGEVVPLFWCNGRVGSRLLVSSGYLRILIRREGHFSRQKQVLLAQRWLWFGGSTHLSRA
jgi:hypothetical protein